WQQAFQHDDSCPYSFLCVSTRRRCARGFSLICNSPDASFLRVSDVERSVWTFTYSNRPVFRRSRGGARAIERREAVGKHRLRAWLAAAIEWDEHDVVA